MKLLPEQDKMEYDIIDSHIHLGKDYFAENNLLTNSRGDCSKLSTKEILKIMNNHGVNVGLIMAFPAPHEFYSGGVWYTKEDDEKIRKSIEENEHLYEVIAFHPKDHIELEKRISKNTRGLKLHTRSTSTDPSELIGHPVLKVAKKYDLPVILHIGTGNEPELISKEKDISLSSAFKLAENEKDIIFIFAHLGRLHKDLYKALELDNVYFDTSGISLLKSDKKNFISPTPIELKTMAPQEIIEHLVNKGYANKIIWGSDEPYGLSYDTELNAIKNSNISRENKEKILCKNAKRIFKL